MESTFARLGDFFTLRISGAIGGLSGSTVADAAVGDSSGGAGDGSRVLPDVEDCLDGGMFNEWLGVAGADEKAGKGWPGVAGADRARPGDGRGLPRSELVTLSTSWPISAAPR